MKPGSVVITRAGIPIGELWLSVAKSSPREVVYEYTPYARNDVTIWIGAGYPPPPPPVIVFCTDCGSEGGKVRYAKDPPRCDACHKWHMYALLKKRVDP